MDTQTVLHDGVRTKAGCLHASLLSDQIDIRGDTVGWDNDAEGEIDNIWSFIAVAGVNSH